MVVPFLNDPFESPPLHDLMHEVRGHVADLAGFWASRAVDVINGGYRTSFDATGKPVLETGKYLLSHTRLVWSFTELAAARADPSLLAVATRGVEYLRDHFWDEARGGWYWKLASSGSVIDAAKLIYGQSFALYALAAYARKSGSAAARDLANLTFDLINSRAIDAANGGYLENLNRDWTPMATEFGGGDRKSLDIHMHLLESFTELALLTGDETHLRRLAQVRELILNRMVDFSVGAGGNQFDLRFAPLDPIVIDRTWIAERVEPSARGPLRPTTSYGHNLELGWLLIRADEVLGCVPAVDIELVRQMADHALDWGYDHLHGGIYREGPPTGPATDTDKEFWQNAEALVGFLQAYEVTGAARYLEAFTGTWSFVRGHLVHPTGEWRMRTDARGSVLDGSLGNHWTGAYHTVRAAIECDRRLARLNNAF